MKPETGIGKSWASGPKKPSPDPGEKKWPSAWAWVKIMAQAKILAQPKN
jgi:hypothetical protein